MDIRDAIYRVVLDNSKYNSTCKEIITTAMNSIINKHFDNLPRLYETKYICVYGYSDYKKYHGTAISEEQFNLISGNSIVYIPVQVSQEPYDLCYYISCDREIYSYPYNIYNTIDPKQLQTYENLQTYEKDIYGHSPGQ
jgi:hypothetical protein